MEGVRGMGEEEEEEEEELEEELLPHKQMKELEEQNKIIWLLYKDTQQQQEQDRHLQPKQQQRQGAEQQQLQQQQRQEQQEQQRLLQQQQQHPWEQQLQEQQWGQWQQEFDNMGMHQSLGDGELHLLPNPLSLSPGGRKRMMTAEEEEEEDEDEDEDDEEMKRLIPPREKTREMEKQNRIIFSLYEDSLQSNAAAAAVAAAAATSAVSSSRFTGTSALSELSGPHTTHTFPHPSTYTTTTTFPSSSTPSLAHDCGGGGAAIGAAVEGLLAQETSPHKALQLNLALQQVFSATVAKLEKALNRNQKAQAETARALESTGLWTVKETLQRNVVPKRSGWEGSEQRLPLMHSRFSIPYFKDASGMSAPMNEDGKRKVDKGYLDLYTIRSRPWIMREQMKLRAMVEQEWKEQLLRKTHQHMRDLERQVKALQTQQEVDEEVLESTQEKVSKAKIKLAKIKNTEPENLKLPPRHTPFDWEQISAQGFDGQRSAVECQLMWNNLLHPWINRGAFTENEDLAIQSLVRWTDNCKENDWGSIAKCLGTKRTAYLVMQRWVSFLEPTLHPVQWTIRDTKKLVDAVSLLRRGEHIPWSQVHQHLPGYTRAQVYSRWQVVNPEKSQRHFTLEEDTAFIKGIYLFGLNFVSVAHFIPGRTYPQVREKFKRTILPTLTTKPWTRREDKILLSSGEESEELSRKLIWHLPRRLPTQNRCRYLTLKLWHSLMGEGHKESSPPPLFPLTNTTDQHQIASIRSLLMQESLRDSLKLKQAVESSRKDINLQPLLQELKVVRATLLENTTGSVAERMQKLLVYRGRYKGFKREPLIPSTHKIFVDRFFEPGRPCETSFPASDKVVNNLKHLSEVMLLKPRPTREEKEEEEEEEEEGKKEEEVGERKRKRKREKEEEERKKTDTIPMTQLDRDLWKQLVVMWEEEKQQRKEKGAKGQDEENTRSSGVDGDEGGGGGVRDMSEGDVVGGVGDMPLIPPNATTLGALHSIFLHLPVLTEMAAGDFIFQNFSPNALASMTDAQLRTQYFEHDTLRLQAKAGKGQKEDDDEGEDEEEKDKEGDEEEEEEEEETTESNREAPNATNTLVNNSTNTNSATTTTPSASLPPPPLATSTPDRRRPQVPSEDRSADSDSGEIGAVIRNRKTSRTNVKSRRGSGTVSNKQNGGNRSSANINSASVSITGLDKFKIHITAEGTRGRKRKVLEDDVSSPHFNTYSKVAGKKIKSKPGTSDQGNLTPSATTTTTTTTSLPQQDTTPAEATPTPSIYVGDAEEENTDQKVARDKADELLFHRMLSLFFWPSVMMTGSPAEWQVGEVERKVKYSIKDRKGEEKKKPEREVEEKTVRCSKKQIKRGRWSVFFPEEEEISVEKMTKEVEELKKRVIGNITKKQELKIQRKGSGKADKTLPPPEQKTGRKRKRSEATEQDTAYPQSSKKQDVQPTSPPPSTQDTEVGVDEEEAQSSSASQQSDVKTILMNITRDQQKLKTLDRSLRMKKVWEGRQQGIYSQRKKKGTALAYRPRGTRTRGRGQQEEEKNNNNS